MNMTTPVSSQVISDFFQLGRYGFSRDFDGFAGIVYYFRLTPRDFENIQFGCYLFLFSVLDFGTLYSLES